MRIEKEDEKGPWFVALNGGVSDDCILSRPQKASNTIQCTGGSERLLANRFMEVLKRTKPTETGWTQQ